MQYKLEKVNLYNNVRGMYRDALTYSTNIVEFITRDSIYGKAGIMDKLVFSYMVKERRIVMLQLLLNAPRMKTDIATRAILYLPI